MEEIPAITPSTPTRSSKELPLNRLSTTDGTGGRIWIYPADVGGFFRRWRTVLHSVLILVFLALPWLRINGHQALLFDIPRRRFAVFGITFWAHDAPMLIFVFGGAAVVLAFVTAIWGRVWCGWACPQTVFIDGVFRRMERWVEGDAVSRKRLDQAPFSLKKGLIKAAKWGSFLAATLLVTHSFLAYFVGAEALFHWMHSSPEEHPVAFLFMVASTGLVLADFGWFREQFCTIVCPYGRIQSVLMDDQSLALSYDSVRGEPRKGTGDCVNCYRCVQVCPTGVDIRRGVQLECIACSACADACDEVMRRLGKPTGLIRYDSFLGVQPGAARKPWTFKASFMRARTGVYLAVIGALAFGLGFSLFRRQPVEMTWVRAVEAPYQIGGASAEGGREIINHYKVDLSNQSFEDAKVEFEVSEEFRSTGIQVVMAESPLTVAPGLQKRADLFIRFPEKMLSLGQAKVKIAMVYRQNGKAGEGEKVQRIWEEVRLVGPIR